jgi:hypothetical protein
MEGEQVSTYTFINKSEAVYHALFCWTLEQSEAYA